MPRAGLIRRANGKMCENIDVVEMKHLHRFRKHPSSFNVTWQPPVHLALVDQFRYEERGPMCVSTKNESTTIDLVRVLRFSRTIAMERHRGVCKTWGAFVSVAHITESSSRRKSLQTTKMYRGKIIWKRPYESDLKTRHDEEIQQAYLKRKRTTKRAGRILFVRAENQGGATTTTSSQQNQRKSSSARDALELAIARSKNRTSKIKHKIMVATPESFLKRIEPSRDESNSGLTFTFVRNTTSRDQPKYVYVTCIFGDSKTRADMIAHAVRVMGKIFFLCVCNIDTKYSSTTHTGPDICYNNDMSSQSQQQLQQRRRRSSVRIVRVRNDFTHTKPTLEHTDTSSSRRVGR